MLLLTFYFCYAASLCNFIMRFYHKTKQFYAVRFNVLISSSNKAVEIFSNNAFESE